MEKITAEIAKEIKSGDTIQGTGASLQVGCVGIKKPEDKHFTFYGLQTMHGGKVSQAAIIFCTEENRFMYPNKLPMPLYKEAKLIKGAKLPKIKV